MSGLQELLGMHNKNDPNSLANRIGDVGSMSGLQELLGLQNEKNTNSLTNRIGDLGSYNVGRARTIGIAEQK